MIPQELLELLGNIGDAQLCYFQFLMGALQGGGSAAAGSAAGGAAAGAAGGAAAGAGGAAAGAAAGAGAAGTAAAAAGSVAEGAAGAGAMGGVTEAAAAAPLDAAQGALTSTPTPAAATSKPAATVDLQAPTSTPPTPPAVQEMMKPSPESVMSDITGPQMSTRPAPESIDLSANMSTEAGPVSTLPRFPRGTSTPDTFMDTVKEWWDSKEVKAYRDTYSKARRVKQEIEGLGGNVRQASTNTSPAPQDQAPQPEPLLQVPQLSRAETTDLKLSGGGDKKNEPPLTFEQLKGMQRSGILDLVSQLRTQGRLFG